MVSVFIIIICVVFIIVFWKVRHSKLASLDFQYDMYKLRDELRYAAIDGKIDRNHIGFHYYDTCFSYVIRDIKYLSLLNLILTANISAQNSKSSVIKKQIDDYSKENSHFGQIQDEFFRLLHQYLVEQHQITVKFIVIPILIPILKMIGFIQRTRDIVNKSISYSLYSPRYISQFNT